MVVSSVNQIYYLIQKIFKVIPDPKPTPVAPKTLTPSRLKYVALARTVRVRVPRALETLTLTLVNIIEPSGCKGLWGYGGWFGIRNHFEFLFIK